MRTHVTSVLPVSAVTSVLAIYISPVWHLSPQLPSVTCVTSVLPYIPCVKSILLLPPVIPRLSSPVWNLCYPISNQHCTWLITVLFISSLCLTCHTIIFHLCTICVTPWPYLHLCIPLSFICVTYSVTLIPYLCYMCYISHLCFSVLSLTCVTCISVSPYLSSVIIHVFSYIWYNYFTFVTHL